MTSTSLFYWQDQFGKVIPRDLKIVYNITAAATSVPVISNSATLITYAALTQDTINSFLGTVDEFTAAQFDATSMGADTIGMLINMQGQCSKIVQMVAKCYSATNTLVTRQCQESALIATTIETAVEVGANGNIGVKVDFGNTPDFDGLTAGTIEIDIQWISK